MDEQTRLNWPRRRILVHGTAALLTAPLAVSPAAAQVARFTPTPPQSEGPFYPPQLPTDTDADLVRVAGAVREAGGEVMYLLGRVRDTNGRLLSSTQVDIWQCDVNGRYLHPRSDGFGPRDNAFQGFGRAITDSTGAFEFRTIKPVPYPGRTPHIHVKVYPDGGSVLTTQLYLRGHPMNRRDGLFRALSPAAKEALQMIAAPGTVAGETALMSVVTLIVT